MMFRLTVVLMLISSLPAFAASPVWVATNGADTPYDPAVYLTGYGISPVEGKATDPHVAEDQALKKLAGRLKTSVDATSKLTDSQFGDQNFSSYQSDVKSLVTLDLSGVEKYESAFDSSQNRWVALAVLNKKQMRQSLDAKRAAEVAQLESDLKEVKALAVKKRLDLLQQSLQTFEQHLNDIVQNVAIARMLGDTVDAESVLQRFYEAKDEVRGGLLAEKILTVDDATAALVKAFDWKSLAGKAVALVPAVYKTSEISGEFFQYLRESLVNALAKTVPGLKVVYANRESKPDYVLKGSYFEARDGWQVVFKLNDVAKGTLVNTYELELDEAFVKQQRFQFVPDNMNIALADREVQVSVFDNPVPTDLQAWTNKGSEGLVFEEGEYIDFTIQANRPGYVSVLYNLAGPKRLRVPLVENVRIFPKDIGRPVKLHRLGPFTPPFGSESAQFFFSSSPNPSYSTKVVTVGGVDYPVLAEDYSSFVVATRGLGGLAGQPSVGSANAQPDPFKTDLTLAITTVAKKN